MVVMELVVVMVMVAVAVMMPVMVTAQQCADSWLRQGCSCPATLPALLFFPRTPRRKVCSWYFLFQKLLMLFARTRADSPQLEPWALACSQGDF